VWLYATLEGVGSARAIDRLCQQHAAYRWLCGGAPINHDLLAGFRRDNAALLDRLLTTWSQIASLPSGYIPSFFASAVLPDGRVIVEGGEYNDNCRINAV
jgi:hypothetical protein